MKTPRKGSLEDKLANSPVILPDTQLPFVNNDPFGNDYLGTMSDINEVFAGGDPIVEGGLEDNTLTIQEVDLGVKRDSKTRTNRLGSGPTSISLKNEYDEAVVMDTAFNVLQKYKYDSTAYTEEAKQEAAKLAKAHENDPILREADTRLQVAKNLSLTALNTELLNQIKNLVDTTLFELKDFKRIKTKEEHIEGKEITFTHSMTLADGVVRIDFTDLASFIGQSDMQKDLQGPFPSKKVFSLSITVESGGPLWYATNEDDHLRTYSKIASGTRIIEASKPTFSSINFRVDSNTDVTIIGTY